MAEKYVPRSKRVVGQAYKCSTDECINGVVHPRTICNSCQHKLGRLGRGSNFTSSNGGRSSPRPGPIKE